VCQIDVRPEPPVASACPKRTQTIGTIALVAAIAPPTSSSCLR
jgi:hypothetical protein